MSHDARIDWSGEATRAETPCTVIGSQRWKDAALFAGICAAALVIRLIYLLQARSVPFFEHLLVDSRRYDEWARRIASGDWRGDGVFFQAPLYPYLLGILYRTFGDDVWTAYLAQALLGALSCGFVFVAGRFFLSRAAGVAAGLLFALYAPAIFFDGLIQKASLASFLFAGCLALLGRAGRRPGTGTFSAIGMTLGMLSLTRENARILIVPILIWVLVSLAASRRRRAVWVLAVVAGMAGVLAPVGLRNLVVGGEFVISSSQLGPNFYIGNNPRATGTYVPLVPGQHTPIQEERNARELAERALARELSSREVSHYWLARSWEFVRSRPLQWLGLLGTKWALVWNAYEIPDANDYYFYRDYSSMLRGLGWFAHFGVLCPLAVGGVALTLRRRRELWILYALGFIIALSVTAFFVLARYRFPLVPLLAIFAGAGLVEGLRSFRRFDRWIVMVLALVAAVAVFCNRHTRIAADMSSLAYMNYADVLTRQGKFAEAAGQYERGLARVPDDAQGHFDAGALYLRTKQVDRAVDHFRAAARIDPAFFEAHNRWGVALGLQGRFGEAVECLERAVAINPRHARSFNDLAYALAKLNRLDQAERAYREALKLQPDFEQGILNLANLFLSGQRYGEALALLYEAANDLPGSEPILDNLARLLVLCPQRELRDPPRAVRFAERLCEMTEYARPDYLDTLAGVYAAAGRFDDSVRTVDRAIEIARSAGLEQAVMALREDRKNYKAGISPADASPESPDSGKE